MSASVPDSGSHNTSGQSYFRNKWLSPPDLHRHGPPVFRELATLIENTANQLTNRTDSDGLLRISSMWSIISRSGLEGGRHSHRGVLSAAYYVDLGVSGRDHGGLLQFYDDKADPGPSHSVVPQSGMLVLFASYLEHSVSRYSGDDPRIVISANLR